MTAALLKYEAISYTKELPWEVEKPFCSFVKLNQQICRRGSEQRCPMLLLLWRQHEFCEVVASLAQERIPNFLKPCGLPSQQPHVLVDCRGQIPGDDTFEGTVFRENSKFQALVNFRRY